MHAGELGIELDADPYRLRQGEDGDPLHGVLEGEVELLLKHEGHEVRIAGCGVGGTIGEEVIFAPGRRSVDARGVNPLSFLTSGRLRVA